MNSCKPILTLVEERLQLVKDRIGDLVDTTTYRRLVGSLQYLTPTRPSSVNGVGIISIHEDS